MLPNSVLSEVGEPSPTVYLREQCTVEQAWAYDLLYIIQRLSQPEGGYI
jgi:hypothetical protein